MNPQDLRAGNYVLWFGSIRQIDSIHGDQVLCLDYPNFNKIKDLRPLPITKELLESVGFSFVFSDLFRLDCGEKA